MDKQRHNLESSRLSEVTIFFRRRHRKNDKAGPQVIILDEGAGAVGGEGGRVEEAQLSPSGAPVSLSPGG